MAEESGRFSWVVRWSRCGLVASLVGLGAFTILLSAVVVDAVSRYEQWAAWFGLKDMPKLVAFLAIAIGSLSLLCNLATALWLYSWYGCVRAWVSAEEGTATAASRIRTVETLLETQAANLQRLADLATLPDEAKSLIYRDRELEAFRETVQADLTRQDYAAAETHIEVIEKRFGYVEEARRLRQEVENSRKASVDEKLDQALFRLQRIVEQHDWARAQREAQRIQEIFVGHPKVGNLPQRIENARLKTKRDLLAQYKEAVEKQDVEKGVLLLRELDRYLSPQEAAALEESARGVFHAKLLNLNVQFKLHVADQRWDQALATGEEIMRDYPNTRMAQEVREKIDLLRQRAAALAHAEA